MLRTLKVFLNRRDWQPPRGTTHVLQWYPPELVEDKPYLGFPGAWDIEPLSTWLAGEHTGGAPTEDGPADRDDLLDFVNACFGDIKAWTPFTVGMEIDGDLVNAPAYWLIPAP